MHIGKELEARKVEKGRLSCDSVAPQVGSARSDSTRFVKVNRRKKNRPKRDPTVLTLRIIRFNIKIRHRSCTVHCCVL